MNHSSNQIRTEGLHLVADNEVADPPIDLRLQPGADGQAHFYIYRAEHVQFTSELFGGGDWHWRLTDPLGLILAECGGYRNREQCEAAVTCLRREAGNAVLYNSMADDNLAWF